MPHVLMQIIVVPIVASFLVLFSRPIIGRKAGWIAIASLVYTSVLLCLVGFSIYQGIPVYEKYPLIGNYMKFDLMADGLSLPVALIINLICVVLAWYSIHYVEHRVDILYGTADKNTKLKYYTRFYALYLLYPMRLAHHMDRDSDVNCFVHGNGVQINVYQCPLHRVYLLLFKDDGFGDGTILQPFDGKFNQGSFSRSPAQGL